MNIKTILRALTVHVKQRRLVGRKLAKSYVSLFLVLMLVATSTFAWFAERQAAAIKSGDLQFQSASSLRINKDKSLPNRITIEDFVLDEASSLDGRNIYFPLGASFTEKTADMFFREGNKGDENKRYVYKDFDLKGTSGNTPVYIKSYKITVGDDVYQDELVVNYENGVPTSQTLPPDCPIRLAFIADSGMTPAVIDPSAQVIDYVENSDAVSIIDDNGVPMTTTTNTDSFASYYYGKTPLFIIPGGQNLNVTLVIWLEGTLGNCKDYIGKKISVDIDIESNFAEMETIKFVDGTMPDNDGGQSHWVSNDNPIIACSYKDPFSDEGRWKTVIMTKSLSEDYTWTAKIPKKAVTNISFYRLSGANDAGERQGTIYNSWHTSPDIVAMLGNANIPSGWYRDGKQDLQTTRQMTDSDGNKYNSLIYTAVHGNGHSVTTESAKRLSPCVGYWDYSGGSGGGGSSGGGGDTNPTSSGGGSASRYDVTVIVDAKDWVKQNVNSGSVLHFTTSSGEDYYFGSRPSENHFEQTFSLNNGDEITGFYLKHASGGTTSLNVSSIFTVSRAVNVQYVQQNNDYLQPNLST